MADKQFQELLESMVTDIIKKHETQLTRDEVKEIVDELAPNLDLIIAKRVKEHFVALAYAILEKFKEEDEEKMDAKDT